MITKLIKTLLACSFLGTSSIALAVPVTFDFTGQPNGVGDPLTYSVGGIDLEVNGLPDPRVAVDLRAGLGVKLLNTRDNNQIDGSGPDETLLFSFSSVVELTNITFGNVQRNDDFTLSIDGVEVFNQDIPGTGSPSVEIVSIDAIGSIFGFSVQGNNDDYFIRNITVQAVPESGTTFVLVGFSLLSLALARRLV